MSATIAGRAEELLRAKNFCNVATLRADGTVHGVPVWVDLQDGRPVVNSAEGRSWPANLRKAGKATVTAMADNNPYEWVSVTADLVTATHEGADEHIDSLAKKYLDADSYPFRQPGEQRIKFVLEPERVYYNAPR